MVIRVQNIEKMKKSYICPEIELVEIENTSICEGSEFMPMSETEEEGEDCGLSASYRTNLWN